MDVGCSVGCECEMCYTITEMIAIDEFNENIKFYVEIGDEFIEIDTKPNINKL